MHDLGDTLLQAGFAEPVIDSQVITITYGDVDKLIADLRQGGSTNATADRNRGLTGRAAGERFRLACAAQAGADGRIPLTIDVIFGLAWTGEAVARERGDRSKSRSNGSPGAAPTDSGNPATNNALSDNCS